MMGWVQKSRNKGGIIFVDLRDRSGIIQLIFEESDTGAEGFEKATKLRAEFVVAVTGVVENRSGAVNESLKTGAIEVRAKDIRILSESETPPFPIEENSKTKDELRLRYRFLDLRRPDLQRNLIMRSKVATLTRQFWQKRDSWRSRHRCLQRVHRKAQEIIWYQAVYIRAILCLATVPAAVQTAAHVFRLRPLFPDCKMFP